MMPVMDGFTTLKILKENKTTKNIPVIVLSAISHDVEMTKALTLGAEDYIQKPFKLKELDIVDKLLNDK